MCFSRFSLLEVSRLQRDIIKIIIMFTKRLISRSSSIGNRYLRSTSKAQPPRLRPVEVKTTVTTNETQLIQEIQQPAQISKVISDYKPWDFVPPSKVSPPSRADDEVIPVVKGLVLTHTVLYLLSLLTSILLYRTQRFINRS